MQTDRNAVAAGLSSGHSINYVAKEPTMALSDRAESDRPNANASDADSNNPQPLLASDTAAQSEGLTVSITTNQPIPLPIDRLNRSIHARVSRNEAHVQKLAELRIEGVEFPPIDVFWNQVTDELWLADGEHRTSVYERAREPHIPANVHAGGRQEALAFAMKCDRGLRREPKDNQHGIRLLLQDSEWAQWSSRVIAKKLGMDHRTVDRIRRRIEGEQASPRIGADKKVRKPKAPTGASPQLSGRKPTDDPGKPEEDLQGVDQPSQGHQQLKQSDTEEAVIDLIKQLVGESHPNVLQEIVEYVPKIVTSDASIDAKAILAHALVWGLDSLANADASWRYKRTPRECYALIAEVTANINARSSKLSTESPSSSPAPDSTQQVIGSRPKMSDERHTALKWAFLDNIQRVIGSSTMNADEVLAALKLAGLLPDYVDPLKYVKFEVGRHPDVIKRVKGKLGYYCLSEGNPYRNAQSEIVDS
jgi:hypothetical protein